IWSLGVMLYELLCLKRPFGGAAASLLGAVLRDEPEPPRQRALPLEVPVELEAACLRALRKERRHRQASTDELLGEVQVWLESEADRAKRRERAEAQAREGASRLTVYFDLKG